MSVKNYCLDRRRGNLPTSQFFFKVFIIQNKEFEFIKYSWRILVFLKTVSNTLPNQRVINRLENFMHQTLCMEVR